MSYIETILERIRIKCFQILIGKENVKVWDEVMTRFVTSLDPHRFAARDEHSDLGIGYESMLNPQNMFLENYCRVQDHLNFISYKGKLKVRKYAAIGSGCIIIPGDHVPTVGVPQYLAGKLHINDVDGEIEVGEDAWIGAGTILLSHCKIGRGAVVAAGAVVSKHVPPYAVVAGIPAKIIATRFDVEQILQHEASLYPAEERMTKEELEQLFNEYFQGKRAIGKSDMTEEDKIKLRQAKEELGMPIYSE
jgi:acetyltransferase-like isoleucine patch superfamily enzyme